MLFELSGGGTSGGWAVGGECWWVARSVGVLTGGGWTGWWPAYMFRSFGFVRRRDLEAVDVEVVADLHTHENRVPHQVQRTVYLQSYKQMIGALGHDSASLYWARDNLGEWDEFCYESSPCKVYKHIMVVIQYTWKFEMYCWGNIAACHRPNNKFIKLTNYCELFKWWISGWCRHLDIISSLFRIMILRPILPNAYIIFAFVFLVAQIGTR